MIPEQKAYIALALDPIHVGIGGYRLGRVDLAIVREPGTNVPKIPGTSIHGAARMYGAYQCNKPLCAGQGQEQEGQGGHCKEKSCPICHTFGYTGAERSYRGVVNVHDALIVAFPIFSSVGPVWITTVEIARENGLKVQRSDGDGSEVTEAPGEDKVHLGKGVNVTGGLALGSLWFSCGDSVEVVAAEVPETNNSAKIALPFSEIALPFSAGWMSGPFETIRKRIVVVNDMIFSMLVNSNLEVRTSVSIDPETGAAKHGALFTYEAIPRSTVFNLTVVHDEYRSWDGVNGGPRKWTSALAVLEDGLRAMEYLGVGGKGTSGFGRLRVFTDHTSAGHEGGENR
jgi:CRISPR-associated protein Cmr4